PAPPGRPWRRTCRRSSARRAASRSGTARRGARSPGRAAGRRRSRLPLGRAARRGVGQGRREEHGGRSRLQATGLRTPPHGDNPWRCRLHRSTIRWMELTHWPLYGLRLRTPRLELRLPVLAELDALAGTAARGVHEPGSMPFGVPWTDCPPAERAQRVMTHFWKLLGEWTPQRWRRSEERRVGKECGMRWASDQ